MCPYFDYLVVATELGRMAPWLSVMNLLELPVRADLGLVGQGFNVQMQLPT